MDEILSIEIPLQAELKRIYFAVCELVIEKQEFANSNHEKNLNIVLNILNEMRLNFDGFIQLFSLSKCLGLEHIKIAIYHGLKNVYKNNMISNLAENELLLYLSIQRQISKAFATMGITKEDFTNTHFKKELLIISPNQISIQKKIADLNSKIFIKPIYPKLPNTIIKQYELAKNYDIKTDFQEPIDIEVLYKTIIARLNEKMIKLTLENLG